MADSVPLSDTETRLRAYVRAHQADDIDLLERSVNISSGTQNLVGVRRVGDLFAAELVSMGFTVRWADMPASMRRAGHLIAERRGTKGARLLLIGHLDTVFEGEGQQFVREDTIARGAGTSDMKGGNVAMIAALRALHATGGLEGSRVVVVIFTIRFFMSMISRAGSGTCVITGSTPAKYESSSSCVIYGSAMTLPHVLHASRMHPFFSPMA